MNVLFLSLIDFDNIDERNIYTDLLREFWKAGHKLYVISPVERKTGKKQKVIKTKKATIIKPRIYDMQKVGYIKKAFSMFTIESILTETIKRVLSNVKFDLVLYATPPITFEKAVSFVKKRDGAVTYLLQKDIFPEGLLDLNVLSTHGWKGIIYNYYRKKEKKLLMASDYIGCMSQANIDYIRNHNPFLDPERVELCPNSIEPIDKSVDLHTRKMIRQKYDIPLDKKVFVYGGNLGKPQGIPFLIECLKKCKNIENAFFLIVGDGTEYHLLQEFVYKDAPKNVKLMKRLPKEDYDTMVGACDVGMIFLDHRFTIPNFPSRLLSYMQAKLPILAVTDPNTDIGQVIVDGGFGWWCESNNVNAFSNTVIKIVDLMRNTMPDKSFDYLQKNYSAKESYKLIISKVDLKKCDFNQRK